ncbi:MAG: 5-formyltetrahydrofolate cyclo-ligase [Armatimonadota bacterium]|nr:5-formyltetrahydrofolate cyclo-ligase [Armatimonadota bacterium]MDW8024530.1 5-formyltetrahydrofolate cyclo-ligase [Armatimonadota bacterium]
MIEPSPNTRLLRAIKKRERIRRRVWWLLELHGVATFPLPVFGRIPNFIGSKEAAIRFAKLTEFEIAQCVYCTLDHSLLHVRELVLASGKKLATALPKMRGVVEIDEHRHIKAASSVKGFERYGKPLQTPIDIFVTGSVAVDRFGNRLGVGKGFTDMEWKWLRDNGLVRSHCKVVTLVHPLQIVEDLAPFALETDLKVDIIVTPDEVIRIGE